MLSPPPYWRDLGHDLCSFIDGFLSHFIQKVANVGDSRAVLSHDGKAVALSRDHKPNRPDEMARIKRAGGVVFCNRVNGELAVICFIG